MDTQTDEPDNLAQWPVEDVLRGSVADIEANRVDDFDAFLAEMKKMVAERIAELEPGPRN